MISQSFTDLNLTHRTPATWPGSDTARLLDFFTTQDGSWEMSNKPYSIEPWAREKYLATAMLGGDHHLYVRVQDPAGNPLKEQVAFQGPNFSAQFTDPKKNGGWVEVPMFENYFPQEGQHGPWSVRVLDMASDQVEGMGLPANQHVSCFFVYTVEARSQTAEPPTIPVPTVIDEATVTLQIVREHEVETTVIQGHVQSRNTRPR